MAPVHFLPSRWPLFLSVFLFLFRLFGFSFCRTILTVWWCWHRRDLVCHRHGRPLEAACATLMSVFPLPAEDHDTLAKFNMGGPPAQPVKSPACAGAVSTIDY